MRQGPWFLFMRQIRSFINYDNDIRQIYDSILFRLWSNTSKQMCQPSRHHKPPGAWLVDLGIWTSWNSSIGRSCSYPLNSRTWSGGKWYRCICGWRLREGWYFLFSVHMRKHKCQFAVPKAQSRAPDSSAKHLLENQRKYNLADNETTYLTGSMFGAGFESVSILVRVGSPYGYF
jgi:hypothetical protein